jgi:extracellular solute-binding protein (family 5)
MTQPLRCALFIVLAACSNARPGAPVAPMASCTIGAPQAGAGDTLSVATTAPVDWTHVPVATNAAERLVFAQLYETLIGVDCDGRARPALAASWTLDATKTRITLSLRHDAMFWSGRPVTADDVLAAWRRSAAQSASWARLARQIASGTTIIDDHTLIVSLPDTAWLALASPTLAIYEQQATARWPEGSGPYRIDAQSAPGGFLLMPIASQSAPYLVSGRMPSADPRDAIDGGSDVLVTDDPLAVAYAAGRANLEAVPLPWRRTYVLAIPTAAPTIASALLRPDSGSETLRASLAHDAVRAEARPAQPPYWWDGSPSCGTAIDSLSSARMANGRSNRVVYRRDDPIARGLAERLVAFDPQSVAAGLLPDDFARSLHYGRELAYVLDLPRASFTPCDDLRQLETSAPWLVTGLGADARLLPLIDTRESAIVNRNRVSATVDWSGTLHFSRP